MQKTRALTNTVGGEYECIHDYRVTNTNASIRRMPADSPLFGKNERSNQSAVLPYEDRNGPQAQPVSTGISNRAPTGIGNHASST